MDVGAYPDCLTAGKSGLYESLLPTVRLDGRRAGPVSTASGIGAAGRRGALTTSSMNYQ